MTWTEFKCSSCIAGIPATQSDFVASWWWPGSPKTKTYLFSMNLLVMWNHLAHNTPGTSERKFLETLGEISKLAGRSHVIDRHIFGMSNRYFQQMEHFIEVEIRLLKLFTCKACGTNPLSWMKDNEIVLYCLIQFREKTQIF